MRPTFAHELVDQRIVELRSNAVPRPLPRHFNPKRRRQAEDLALQRRAARTVGGAP